jgi:hypothetical protein
MRRMGGEPFPADFMFQLPPSGGRRYLPYFHTFTEHGVALLSPVLSSKRAVQMNIVIIREFVKLRQARDPARQNLAKRDRTRKVYA